MSLHKTQKYIFKNKTVFPIAVPHASRLLSGRDAFARHQRGHGYIHVGAQFLGKTSR